MVGANYKWMAIDSLSLYFSTLVAECKGPKTPRGLNKELKKGINYNNYPWDMVGSYKCDN